MVLFPIIKCQERKCTETGALKAANTTPFSCNNVLLGAEHAATGPGMFPFESGPKP